MLIIALRQLLVFAHVMAFAFAIVAVLREDLALLRAGRVQAAKLHATGQQLAWLLGLLWLTGLTLIALDIGLDPAVLMTKAKLSAKISVVAALTVNGLLLHWLAFPMLTRPQRSQRRAVWVCMVLGTVSSVSWVFAAFVGVARLAAPHLSYAGFMSLYAAGLALGMVAAWTLARPRLYKLVMPDLGAGRASALR